VSVSRLWLMSENADAPWQVIDAVASLQACIDCTLKASSHKLTWQSMPKLADMEICGFYTYAGFLAQATARKLSDRRLDHGLAEQLPTLDKPLGVLQACKISDTGGDCRKTTMRLARAGQCHHCCESIDFTLPRVLIELEVNTPMRSGMQLGNVFRVGEYCNPCSRELFPIRSDGSMSLDIW